MNSSLSRTIRGILKTNSALEARPRRNKKVAWKEAKDLVDKDNGETQIGQEEPQTEQKENPVYCEAKIYCNRKRCLYLSSDIFTSVAQHDNFVLDFWWKCDDEYCSCQSEPYCTERDNHYFVCDELECPCGLYFGLRDHSRTRIEHNNKMDECGFPFRCQDRQCQCRQKEMFSPTEADHNKAMSKVAPEEEEEGRLWNPYGAAFFC